MPCGQGLSKACPHRGPAAGWAPHHPQPFMEDGLPSHSPAQRWPWVTLEGHAGAGASLPGASREPSQERLGWEVPARSRRSRHEARGPVPSSGRGSGVSPEPEGPCTGPQAKGSCCGSLCSGTGRSWCLWPAGRSSCGQGSLHLISDAASTPPPGRS